MSRNERWKVNKDVTNTLIAEEISFFDDYVTIVPSSVIIMLLSNK